MNYSQLVTYAQEFLENEETSFVANIPIFVKMTEEEIYRSCQFAFLRKTSTVTFTGGSPELAIPSDYLSAYSLAVISSSNYTFLISKDPNFIREMYPDGGSGLPRFFAQLDENTLLVGPVPSSSYSAELQYFYKPESIVTASTNWLSENCETALLYGTLYNGYAYMKGDQDVINTYREKFDKAIMALKEIEEGRVRKDTYRVPDRRITT